jgi:hypothetical protein
LIEEKITARVGQGLLRLAALQNRTFDVGINRTPSSANLQLFGGGCTASLPGGAGDCPPGYAPIVFNGATYALTFNPAYFNSQISSSANRDLLFSYETPLGNNLRAGASFVRSYDDSPSTYCSTFGDSSLPSAVAQTTNEFRIFLGATPSAKTSVDLSEYVANVDYHVQNPNDLMGNTYVDTHQSYVAPRLGFVWRPTAAIAVRAAAGGGFAEAPLADLVGTNAPYPCAANYYCVTKPNLDIQPEKSFGFDLGTDVRLHRNTVLSFDVYRTNLYGQFYNLTSITGTYLGLPLYATQNGNLGESRYEGVLVDLRHDAPHGLYWALSGGLTRGYVLNVPPGFYNTAGGTCTIATGADCTNLTVVPNINFNGTFTGVSVPYSQALGKLGYRWAAEKYLDLTGTYYGNNNTYFRPAFVELDGNISYPLSKNASVLVTFRNITGIYDGAIQTWSPAILSGAPTISGLPYPQYGEEYGPRTILLVTQVHL